MNPRLSSVRQILREEKLSSVIISSLSHIVWLTDYGGFSNDERECYLLITASNSYLFTDLRYTEAVRLLVPHFHVRETNASNPFPMQLTEIAKNESLETIGCETNNLTVDEFLNLKKTKLNLESLALSELRIHKGENEIEKIQKACGIGDETFAYIQNEIKEGMTEKDVAKLMELHMKDLDAEPSFRTIVAFGENAAVPHHLSSARRLKRGDCILMDFGVKYDDYCSDMTRTIFFGEPTEKQTKVYEVVKEAQKEAIKYIEKQFTLSKQVSASDADKAARQYIIKSGYPSIPHSLGHGIGIEVHEAPSLSPQSGYTLSDGMVFSIEPGIYLNGDLGVRIEDLYTIRDRKLEQLTHAPKELIQAK